MQQRSIQLCKVYTTFYEAAFGSLLLFAGASGHRIGFMGPPLLISLRLAAAVELISPEFQAIRFIGPPQQRESASAKSDMLGEMRKPRPSHVRVERNFGAGPTRGTRQVFTCVRVECLCVLGSTADVPQKISSLVGSFLSHRKEEENCFHTSVT